MPKKRYAEIDVLYSIGILLVLIGHSHSSSRGYGNSLGQVITFIYTFHMPLFFCISGFLFENSDSLGKNGFYKWVNNKALRLLFPYICWSLIGIVPKYYFENNGFSGLTFSYLIRTIIFPRESVWGHFWFLPVLFNIYLIFGILKTVAKKEKILCLLFVISISLAYFFPLNVDFLGMKDVCQYSIYFVFGAIVNYFCKKDTISLADRIKDIVKSSGGRLS